jgi:hypothetical protein
MTRIFLHKLKCDRPVWRIFGTLGKFGGEFQSRLVFSSLCGPGIDRELLRLCWKNVVQFTLVGLEKVVELKVDRIDDELM